MKGYTRSYMVEDAVYLARNLRQEDIREVSILGVDPLFAMVAGGLCSGVTYTGVGPSGKPALAVGVRVTANPDVGMVWMLGTPEIEDNFGDGMFTQLFKPVLSKVHPCTIEEVKHSIQKERRIIDTLEPVMARHKLVFDKGVISHDLKSTEKYATDIRHYKTLVYQMTRICYDRGALKFDDRLDALAIAVAYWTEKMAQDEDQGLKREKDRLFDMEIEAHLNALTGGKTGGEKWFHLV